MTLLRSHYTTIHYYSQHRYVSNLTEKNRATRWYIRGIGYSIFLVHCKSRDDAPVLRLADVGIAIGGLGSDAAIESADAVIMTDNVARVADMIAISQRTKKRVFENVILILTFTVKNEKNPCNRVYSVITGVNALPKSVVY